MVDNIIRIKVIADTGQMTAGLARANKQISTLGATVSRVGRTMVAFAALFVARKLIGGIGESIKAFAEFEKGVANIGILLGDEISRIDEFQEAVRGISLGLGLASKDVLKAGFDIQSATNDVSESLEIMAAASRLAVAGGSNMASTTSGLLTLMESYDKSLRGAADGANLLLKTQQFARATIGDLSTSISKFLPVASQMGVKQEELLGIFAQLTRSLGSAKEASTALSMILQNLIKGTGELQSWSQRMFDTNIQNAVATKGLATVMEELSLEESGYIGKLITRQRAIKAVTSTTGKWADIQDFINGLLDRSSFVQDKLNIQMETSQIRLNKLTEAWADFKRSIGEIVAETDLPEKLTAVAKTLQEVAENEKLARFMRDNFKDSTLRLQLAIRDMAGEMLFSGKSTTETMKVLMAFKSIMDGSAESTSKLKQELDKIVETRRQFLEDAETKSIIEAPTEEELNAWDIYFNTITEKLIKLEEDAAALSEKMGVKITGSTLAMAQAVDKIMTGLVNSISAGFGKTMADIIIDGKDAGEALKAMWEDVAKSIIALIAQMIAKMIAWIAIVTIARAMGVPIPGGGGLGGLTKFLGFHEGGIVPGLGVGDKVPALLEPGELVVPRDQVKGGDIFNSSPTINVSLAGAILLDDPNAVKRLYREGLRDQIRDDIRTRRDTFF